MMRIPFFSFFFLTVSLLPRIDLVYSQPDQLDQIRYDLALEEINFRVRRIESSPSPLNLIEIYVAVFNRSRKVSVPPNSINLAIVPKEITFVEMPPEHGGRLEPHITPMNVALPPRTGRILVTGFSLPQEELESVTFEIQINPPEGEKKTVTWKGN